VFRSGRLTGLALAVGLVVGAVAAGCAETAAPSATPGPSQAAATAPESRAPATAAPTSAPTTTAAVSRTPDPDQLAAAGALEAFGALTRSEDLSYHLAQTGTFEATAGSAAFEYAIDVAGDDFSAVMTVGSQTSSLRAIGDTLYVQGEDGTWTETPLDAGVAADITNPWQYLGSLDELTFVSRAPQQVDAFQFANGGPIDYQTNPMRESGIVGAITTLTFVVMPDGTPVEILFDAEAPDGQGGTVAISSIVRFSDVGTPVVVEAPVP
jgi:pyruvate/2-oxoglutarate dehydrogenase complex dihydrolipoamide acyltransferase (E2) component